MRCVYGPVLSWRLGRSLGVDPLLPPKTCTFECIYCQLGRTVRKVSGPEEVKGRVSEGRVLSELKGVEIDFSMVDFITFSGTGEPTLNLEVGRMVEGIRATLGDGCPPIAILTNSSLTCREDVRENLKRFDLVMAKLDAANEEMFMAVNNPSPSIRFWDVVEGLKKLRREVEGRLAAQIMLFQDDEKGIDGSSVEVVEEVAALTREIGFHEVYLNTPSRPPFIRSVKPLSQFQLRRAAEVFAEKRLNVHYYGAEAKTGQGGRTLTEEDVFAVVKRRPCRFADLAGIFASSEEDLEKLDRLLRSLSGEGRIRVLRYRGETFYAL